MIYTVLVHVPDKTPSNQQLEPCHPTPSQVKEETKQAFDTPAENTDAVDMSAFVSSNTSPNFAQRDLKQGVHTKNTETDGMDTDNCVSSNTSPNSAQQEMVQPAPVTSDTEVQHGTAPVVATNFTMGEDRQLNHCVILPDEVYQRWSTLRTALRFATDAQVANLLLNRYRIEFRPHKKRCDKGDMVEKN